MTKLFYKYSAIILLFVFQNADSFAWDSTFSKMDSSVTDKSIRLKIIYSGSALIYTGTLIGLNKYWYENYPRSAFHFFDDNNEWKQIDKTGHIFTAYYLGYQGINAFRWAGKNNRKGIWYGGMAGSLFLTVIEILDGFSQNWGASYGDILTNTAGSFLVTLQELKWHDQKFKLKFSTHKVNYSDDVLKRADYLYGNGALERILKDYNGQTYWLSFNPFTFCETIKYPKWLNIAVGLGAEGMLGGFSNQWIDKTTNIAFDRNDIPRYRQYYFSIDIDFTKIKTRSKVLSSLFKTIGFIKIPAPAIEYNRIEKLTFKPFYF